MVCAAFLSAMALCSASHADSPFATRVVSFDPAPGQFVRNPAYNDPLKALGAPIGGGLFAPANDKVVSLGGFGGSITLGFDSPIVNLPPTTPDGFNPIGLDFIVFGNAFYAGSADGQWRFAELVVVEVSRDVNANGLADDPWYLIPGSRLQNASFPLQRVVKAWDDNTADTSRPPANPAWIPVGRSGVWTSSTFAIPGTGLVPPVFVGGGDGLTPASIWGYADCSPTLLLGDLDADGVSDDPSITPEMFYTRPGNPLVPGVDGFTPGTGGGDAFDISWAIDPTTGLSANLPSIDFVRLSTGVDATGGLLGEVSGEIGGVARVVLPVINTTPCDIADDAGTPLRQPNAGTNNGVNEGDYNAFFASEGFFFLASIGPAAVGSYCDIADDAGDPLPSTSGAANNGVNEGDYNAFFNCLFR
ncbi:MAG: hypothetical protein IBJ18_07870 [Phycisphaerales bacterium]|nr:hypothetical protein [Phycisphaerales bacterium]